VVLAIDNLRGKAMAIAAAHVPAGSSPEEVERIHADAAGRAADLVRELREAESAPALELLPEPEADPEFSSSTTRAAYQAGVERIRDYIRAGDAFQVVLSQRLGMTLRGSPFDLYRALRSLNPSPYLFYLEMDGVTLVGSSPEVLVRLEDGTVTVRPIAGTRPRGATAGEDRELAADLRTDEKELAEHRMLVDLGRNDVGRVGTVSGAPKIRAMEIIDELEPVRRGPYAGAVGHFSYGGERMDTAIAIRTVLVTGGRAYVQAGAGVVADSNPSAEYEETLNKARALLRAASMVPPRN
jgi:anthranilate synthase component 1